MTEQDKRADLLGAFDTIETKTAPWDAGKTVLRAIRAALAAGLTEAEIQALVTLALQR